MTKLPKVLITGAKGFVGTQLAPSLSADGYRVVTTDREQCDLSDLEAVRRLMERELPDFVIHLAGRTTPGRDLSDMDLQYRDTILAARNVALAQPEPTRLTLYFGSIEEYGDNVAPFTEDMTARPISPYGWAKISAYNAVDLVSRLRRVPFVWLRPSLLYGPGMPRKRFLGSVVDACLSRRKVALTPCDQSRDFLYIGDLCRMIEQVLRQPDRSHYKIFNLTTETRIVLRDAVKLVGELTGGSEYCQVGAIPHRENEMMMFYSSSELFRRTFGEAAATPFEEGIRTTIESLGGRAV